MSAAVQAQGVGARPGAVIAAFVLGTAGSGGFTLLPETLPALASAFHLSPGEVGLVSTLELVGVTSGAAVAGLISRRVPVRGLAVLVTAILLACALSTMVVTSIAVLAGIRFVDGIMAGVALSLAYSVLSTTARPDRNFAALAIFPLIYGTLGFALIPGFQSVVGWHASFIVLSCTDLIALVAAFWMTAPLRSKATRLTFIDSLPSARGWLALASVVAYYTGAVAIYAFAFNIGLQMTKSDVISGNVLSLSQIVGIVGCVVAIVLAGRAPRRPSIAIGFAVTAVGIVILLIGNGGTPVYVISLFAVNLAWNFLAGCHIAAVSTLDTRGSAAAFLAVAINGGSALGPLLGFTVIGNSYAVLEIVSTALIGVALVLIMTALRGRQPALANGGPVLDEEVLDAV